MLGPGRVSIQNGGAVMDLDTRKKLAEIVHPAHVHDYELSEEEREMRQAGLACLGQTWAHPSTWEWENFGLSGQPGRCSLCGEQVEAYYLWIWKYRSQKVPTTATYVFMCTEREACRFRAAVRSPL